MHPGPIDNRVLIGLYGDELSRLIVENVHFVLLPDNVFQMLLREFKGGEYVSQIKSESEADLSGIKIKIKWFKRK